MIRRAVGCVVLGLAAGCAPALPPLNPTPGPAAPTPTTAPPAPVVTPPAPPPTTTPTVGLRYGPGTTRYLVQRRIENVQEFGGAEQRTTLGFSIFVTATVRGPGDTAGYAATFAIDSVTADSGVVLPSVINLGRARGLSFSGVLTPRGEFRNSAPSDSSAARSLAQIIGGFREFFPRIPAAGVAPGNTWTDTVTQVEQFGVIDSVQIRSVHNAHAVGWEEQEGLRGLRIEVRSTVGLAGNGRQGGQAVNLTGSGTRQGVEYVAPDGRYLGGVSRDSTALTITLQAQGVIVPVRQVALSVIRVRP